MTMTTMTTIDQIVEVTFVAPVRSERMRVLEGPFRSHEYGWAYLVAPVNGGSSVIVPETRVTKVTIDQLTPAQLDEFFNAYVECALWSSIADNGDSLDMYDVSIDCHNTMLNDCRLFAQRGQNYEYLMEALEHAGYNLNKAGHDFWLTRNLHGAGFWDRGLGAVGERLTEAAHYEGSIDLYVSDDGEVEQA